MIITVFAKKRMTEGGKVFHSYISTLTNKHGDKKTVAVKFRMECGEPKPEKCPMNIIVEKTDANLSEHTFVDTESGELKTGYTLWVSAWTLGEAYEDHSLDEYE